MADRNPRQSREAEGAEQNAPHNEEGMARAQRALARLKAGNRRFLTGASNAADLSPARVRKLAVDGQHPFAAVICCADSRVPPEHVFMQGLGALFTIRTAGNVVGPLEAASAYYAASDLQVPLIAVVGHTGCGAIGAAQAGGPTDADLEPLLARVRRAIGTEPDPYAASAANVRAGLAALRATPGLAALEDAGQLMIVGAVLHTDTGAVDFLDR